MLTVDGFKVSTKTIDIRVIKITQVFSRLYCVDFREHHI